MSTEEGGGSKYNNNLLSVRGSHAGEGGWPERVDDSQPHIKIILGVIFRRKISTDLVGVRIVRKSGLPPREATMFFVLVALVLCVRAWQPGSRRISLPHGQDVLDARLTKSAFRIGY